MNGHELRKVFDEFNSKYFEGKLPQYRIRVKRLGAADGRVNRSRRLIWIGVRESHSQQETLLHEMVHGVAGNGHGERFLAELRRLQQIGAPLGETEVNAILMGVRLPLTKTRFRDEVKEFLTVCDPQGRFESFVECVNGDQGYTDSVAEFVRKYPWSKDAFRAVARKCEAERALMASLSARLKPSSQIQK